MKKSLFLLSLLVFTMFFNVCNNNKKNSKDKDDQTSPKEEFFLGQKPPGMIPELFAPGVVSTKNLGESYNESQANIFWVSAEVINKLRTVDLEK